MNLTHKLLVATPKVTDPVFSKSVVFIFRHQPDKGAEGIILNSREIGKVGFGHMSDVFDNGPPNFDKVKEMISKGQLDSVPLYAGGPCQTPGIFFIHAYEEYSNPMTEDEKPEYDLGIPTSFNLFDTNGNLDAPPVPGDMRSNYVIMDGLYFGSPASFAQIIEADRVNEKKFRFFTGQSGWSPGQLEREIAAGSWTIMDFDPKLFFDVRALNNMTGKKTMGGYNIGKNQPQKPEQTESKYKPGGVHDWLSRFNPSQN